MASEFNKRKINPPQRPRGVSPTPTVKDVLSRPEEIPMVCGAPVAMEQAKNYAIAQAQQDGCTANFRIFDSPFGNFLIPVIPTRAELSG
ncbi:hypothetical protein RND81_07G091500 [Saponaria officinalis]|uniref:Uncharacterized protein n=1 Tax=Saponaria officinalis TaxID=3572 RepID=A0AAW1JSD0_SAPOF